MHLRKQPEIYWICTLGGRFDLVFAVRAANPLEFDVSYARIIEKFSRQIRESAVVTRLDVSQFRRDYLVGTRTKVAPRYFGRTFQKQPIDETDLAIINYLSAAARASHVEIAENLQLSRLTVGRRIAALENRHIIQAYTPLIAAQDYGYQIYQVLIKFRLKSSAVLSRLQQLAAICPEIVFIVHVIGPWDVELSVEVPGQKELNRLLGKLRGSLGDEIASLEVLITFDACLKYKLAV